MFLEDDMCAPPTIDVVRRACIADFNMKRFDCDIQETERGPPIENLNEVKNFNGTFFVTVYCLWMNRTIQALLTTSIVGGAHMSSSKNIYSF